MIWYDLCIYQGATLEESVLYNASLDLSSGYTAEAKFRTHPFSESTTVELTSVDGLDLTSDGEISFLRSAAETALYEAPSSGVYDVILTEIASGKKTLVVRGNYQVFLLSTR